LIRHIILKKYSNPPEKALAKIAPYLPDRLRVNVPGFVDALLGEVKRYGGQQ